MNKVKGIFFVKTSMEKNVIAYINKITTIINNFFLYFINFNENLKVTEN